MNCRLQYGQDEERERLSFSNEMEVAKLAAPPNLEVRFVSCNESAIKRWLSYELEETVFSLTHELFMSKHHTVTLNLAFYSGMLEISHGLHDAQSYPHLYLVLKDPHQSSLSFFYFFIGAGFCTL